MAMVAERVHVGDVLENANERLDGSGYPAGKRRAQLSELARLVSVLKAINKLTHERNGVPPRAPLDAYRWVNDASEAYDKTVLVEYIQHYGLYPIGSLAKFSGGFVAWIMDIDAKGMPTKVNVIKNLSFKDTNIDYVLSSKDFSQIGKLEGVVNPADYGIRIAK
ncbi:HD domain-containing phosphohydrolase [Billgrantia antri]|uniref:HD domain-containing phosphohydrolase n=1 Tax=Billgrantia antri TaxID=2846777 RepID=UPI003B2150FA